MYETKHQVTQRKIRNGLRKQAAVIQCEKEKVWEILKTDTSKPATFHIDNDVASYYCPYIPIMRNSDAISSIIMNLETTA